MSTPDLDSEAIGLRLCVSRAKYGQQIGTRMLRGAHCIVSGRRRNRLTHEGWPIQVLLHVAQALLQQFVAAG